LKSSDCSTITAAVPSPKWLRSTRFAAASQSGTESARLMEPSKQKSSSNVPAKRHEHTAAELLLPAENHNFLVIFRNIIEELPGIHIFNIGLKLRLFQVKSPGTCDRVSILSAGM